MPPFLKYEWEEGEQMNVPPPYDFSAALALSVMERFKRFVATLQEQAQAEAAIYGETLTPLQPGFSDSEIAGSEQGRGTAFALEVREFLRHWNRVEGAGGFNFYGPDSWITDEKFMGKKFDGSYYLVIVGLLALCRWRPACHVAVR